MSNPLSPLAMLATSRHAQPGVYALLLGSGVSTGAGVPTGWGVVAELVRRVAAVEDPASIEDAASDPEKWWHDHHGGPLGYSSLLEALAPTPATRQGLLAPPRRTASRWPKSPSRERHRVLDNPAQLDAASRRASGPLVGSGLRQE